ALRQLGCQVDSANDGQQAITGWEATRYDVILMDCHMPNMDGIEAAKIIRVREATDGRPRTPILALTANARGEDYERCIAAGMDDYLTKPLTLDELRVALDRWVGRRTAPAEPKAEAYVAAEQPVAVPAAPIPEAGVEAERPAAAPTELKSEADAKFEQPIAADVPPAVDATVSEVEPMYNGASSQPGTPATPVEPPAATPQP